MQSLERSIVLGSRYILLHTCAAIATFSLLSCSPPQKDPQHSIDEVLANHASSKMIRKLPFTHTEPTPACTDIEDCLHFLKNQLDLEERETGFWLTSQISYDAGSRFNPPLVETPLSFELSIAVDLPEIKSIQDALDAYFLPKTLESTAAPSQQTQRKKYQNRPSRMQQRIERENRLVHQLDVQQQVYLTLDGSPQANQPPKYVIIQLVKNSFQRYGDAHPSKKLQKSVIASDWIHLNYYTLDPDATESLANHLLESQTYQLKASIMHADAFTSDYVFAYLDEQLHHWILHGASQIQLFNAIEIEKLEIKKSSHGVLFLYEAIPSDFETNSDHAI